MSDKKPIRILQINSGSRDFGGVSSFLYNVYTHIDRNKVQFDFLSPNITTYGIHKEEIKQMGGKIAALGITGNILSKKLKLYARMKTFLKRHPYEIVHINSGNFFFNLFVAKAVKKAGVKNIYIHSHSTENPDSIKAKKKATLVLKKTLANCGTRLLACSSDAAEFMFGPKKKNDVEIVRNGVVIERFAFNAEVRDEMRAELGISDKHVIGNVGRFTLQKNHSFMIDVFSQLAERDENAVLLLIGDGEGKEEICRRIEKEGLNDRVIILGTQTEIEKYYQAMDVFCFPSNWEGLGMVLVEAQIAGLPCVASTRVPEEAAICEAVHYIDINPENVDDWVEAIMDSYRTDRQSRTAEAYKCGYSIDDVAVRLEHLYLQDE